MSNICFIPARNSSTRFKDKNIAPFKDGNLVTHTIEQAIESKIFDSIILSSNDESILEMGYKYPVDIHLRSDKHDQLIGVIQEAIESFSVENTDTVCLLLVTCPLRSVEDIQESHKLFLRAKKEHTVVSVKENENPIQMAFDIDMGGYLIPAMPEEYKESTKKQAHATTYFYNDAVIFDLAGRFLDPTRNLFGHKPIPYVMSWERSIAIDYEFQLKVARALGE